MRPTLKLSQLANALAEPVPGELMRAFRFFFSFHIFLNSLKLPWLYPDDWRIYLIQFVMLLAALTTLSRRFYAWGVLVLLVYKGYWIYVSFPMTGNHYYAEFFLLLLLLVFPDRKINGAESGYIDGAPVRLGQLLALSIYFYSGIHKIVQGLWLSGEFITRSLFTGEVFGIWETTKRVLLFLQPAFGMKLGELPLSRPTGFESASFMVPDWSIVLLLILSWIVVITEVGIPVLVLFGRTRRVGLWLMLLLQIGVGVYSWETEFMFAAIGCILLFFRGRVWRNFGVLLALHALWTIIVVAADFRIWEL